ncbi:hypothetical protein IJC60_02110 [bacterium]|nr:hypothetical protein [bacterium]
MGKFKQKIISLFIIFSFFMPQISFADELKGKVEQTEVQQEELDKKLFTGEVEKLNEIKSIKMTVSQVLSSGYTIEGDEFFAEISQDVESEKGVIVPTGTIVHGSVARIVEPKNFGRDGYILLDFDYLITPDGREIPIKGEVSTKENVALGTAKAVAEHAGYTLAGGVVGGIFALNLFGAEAAIASQGYTIAGGAAVGGVIGLTAAMMRKGEGVLIKPGDEIKIKVLSDTSLPVFRKDAFRQEELFLDGLEVRINNIVYSKDPFGEDNFITISLGIFNNTDNFFSTFDIALVSETRHVYFPSPFGDTSLWFKTITPGERAVGKLSFCVDDKKKHHWLVFYDKRTKKPLAKYSITNAEQKLKDLKSDKKKKRRKR